MVIGKDVIAKLNNHLGENGTFVWRWYGGGTGWAWCLATVCWAFAKAGASKLFYDGKKVSYCPTSFKWCQNKLAQIPMELALAGDVIYFDWDGNGVPNHIGFVRKRKDHNSVYTVEGNAGSPSKVRQLTRPAKYVQAVFRIHYPLKSKPTTYLLKLDGIVGKRSVYSLQHVLGIKEDGILGKTTVKAIQRLVGASVDGHWGTNTSKKLQKFLKQTVDGDFGKRSQMALQSWVNTKLSVKPTTKKPVTPAKPVVKKSKTPKADKLVELAKEYAYVYGTTSKRCGWEHGSPKESYKKALNKAYPDRTKWGKATSKGCSCDVFVGTVIRNAGVYAKMGRGLDEQWKDFKKMKNIFKEVKPSEVRTGDIVTYVKRKGGGHICICVGDRVAEAGHEHYYPKIGAKTADRVKTSDKAWIKVYRVREE